MRKVPCNEGLGVIGTLLGSRRALTAGPWFFVEIVVFPNCLENAADCLRIKVNRRTRKQPIEVEGVDSRNGVDGDVSKFAKARRVMRENYGTMNATDIDTLGEKRLKQIGRVVELLAGAATALVSERFVCLDEISVPVVFITPPAISIAVNDAVYEFDLDSKDAAWPEKYLVDFAFRVAIAGH